MIMRNEENENENEREEKKRKGKEEKVPYLLDNIAQQKEDENVKHIDIFSTKFNN